MTTQVEQNLEIVYGKKYLIMEKPTEDTPPELRKIGRAKMGDYFFERASYPYNITLEKYDTGLDETSSEFVDKTTTEINKILKDRASLKKHLEAKVKASGMTETEFLEKFSLHLSHNKVIDTTNMDNYLKLHLAMRGTSLAPEGEVGNISKYGNSMYKLVDSEKEINYKKEFARKKYEVKAYINKLLVENRKEAVAYLIYLDLMQPKTDKEDYLLAELLDRNLENFDFTETAYKVIKDIPKEDIYLKNEIRQVLNSKKVTRQAGQFVFEGEELGSNLNAAFQFLKLKTNEKLLKKLVGDI